MGLKTSTIDPRLVRADADDDKDEKKEDKREDKDEREDAGGEKALSMAIPDGKAIMDALSGCMDALKSTNDRMDAMEARRDKRRDAEDEDKDEKKEDKREDKREDGDDDKDEKKEDKREDKRKDGDEDDGKPERMAADKRKDEDKDKDKERDDARSDAIPALRNQVKSMEETIRTLMARNPAPLAVEDARLVAEAQARADGYLVQIGQHAPRPQVGEDAMTYRRRVLRDLRQHSPALAEVNLYGITDEAGFAVVEERIYADSIAAFNDPANVPAGRLMPVETTRDGHTFREFRGEPRTWMDPMGGAATHKVEGTWGG